MIKIGIIGYGNLGRGVEIAITKNPDMELIGVFTRRDPKTVTILTPDIKVYDIKETEKFKDSIDVMILCGGSATDLPLQGPQIAKSFTIVDSYDTHAKIPEHFANIDAVCQESGTIGVISTGWDPGLFSLNRIYGEVVLPVGETYTFWGSGVSQGHSDAIRRLDGVKNAIQYTVPINKAVEAVRVGKQPKLTTREKHTRECYVEAIDGADRTKIETEIVNMPNYFAEYDTTVTFISEEELERKHNKMPHGGFVIRSGKTGLQEEENQIIEYSLKLDSNPQFTASVLTAYARAAYRMNKEGMKGAKTVFDVAPGYLSIKTAAKLREELL